MNLNYKKAGLSDIDLLTATRMEVLRAVFNVTDEADLPLIEKNSYEYYRNSLKTDVHVAYLVIDKSNGTDRFAASGGISFYQIMPTCDNPDGRKAYVMNMYTRPEYRRQGIAGEVLELLIAETLERGITCITLDASEMGRPVYEKHGFIQMQDEMRLNPCLCKEAPKNKHLQKDNSESMGT